MTIVALVLSLLVAALGALGVMAPAQLLGVVRHLQTPTGLYLAAGIRVALGLALWFAAPASRAPDLIRVLGVIITVAGLMTPFFGLERFRRLLEWWTGRGPAFARGWAAVALVVGLVLAYAVVP